MPNESERLAWLPEGGVTLSHDDLVRLFRSLRAMVLGTNRYDMNRVLLLDIVDVVVSAMERERGGEQ